MNERKLKRWHCNDCSAQLFVQVTGDAEVSVVCNNGCDVILTNDQLHAFRIAMINGEVDLPNLPVVKIKMTEQEFIDACDLRTWRVIRDAMMWIADNDTTQEIKHLIHGEMMRLEEIVGTEKRLPSPGSISIRQS